MEMIIMQRESNNVRFSFLKPADPYHAYYQFRLEEMRTKGAISAIQHEGNGAAAAQDERPAVKAVDPLLFLIPQPTLSHLDSDVINLTAQYIARFGRKFMTVIAQKESQNYQFDFLKPSHSLFRHFSRLVESYERVLALSAQRPTDSWASLLARYRERRAFEKDQLSRQLKAEEVAEMERGMRSAIHLNVNQNSLAAHPPQKKAAFMEIDWDDFALVGAVDFTPADEISDLNLPQRKQDLMSMSLAQKHMIGDQQNERPVAGGQGRAQAVKAAFFFFLGGTPNPISQPPKNSTGRPGRTRRRNRRRARARSSLRTLATSR